MTINELCALAHDNSREHGFWDGVEDVTTVIPEKLCLIHAEVSEALEEYRAGHVHLWIQNGKPEGLVVELADAVIRICDLYEALRRRLGLESFEEVIAEKHKYNMSRAYRHGGKKA